MEEKNKELFYAKKCFFFSSSILPVIKIPQGVYTEKKEMTSLSNLVAIKNGILYLLGASTLFYGATSPSFVKIATELQWYHLVLIFVVCNICIVIANTLLQQFVKLAANWFFIFVRVLFWYIYLSLPFILGYIALRYVEIHFWNQHRIGSLIDSFDLYHINRSALYFDSLSYWIGLTNITRDLL